VMASEFMKSLKGLAAATHCDLDAAARHCEAILTHVKKSCRTQFAQVMFLKTINQGSVSP
jgi:hypothetical protein